MRRRRKVLTNVGVGVVLASVVLVTVESVLAGREAEPAVGATAVVRRGTVTSTVTGTGNVESGTKVAVALKGSAGTVLKIYVRNGQRVGKGDKLLRVDDAAAKRSLATARSDLRSARADYTTAVQASSSQDRAVDDASVRSARTALANARRALAQARATHEQDVGQQAALTKRAAAALDEARDRRDDDRDALDDAKSDLAAAEKSGDAAALSAAQSAVATLQGTIRTDDSAVDTAKTTLASARQTRDKTLLADRQAVQTQGGAVDTARDALASAQATRSSNQQPARPGAVAAAQAKVDSAEVGVAEAEQTLADTVLRAPVAGRVADVSAVVGQPSSAAATGTATSAGSGASSGGSSSSSGSSTSSGSGTSSGSSASSGLVDLVDPTTLQVAAQVAEADVGKVSSAQRVSVVFPASGRTTSGTVGSVAPESDVVDNVVQYEVDVTLPRKTSAARLGQTATLSITTAEHADVLYLPTSALSTSGGRTTVLRRAGGQDSVVEVEPGLVGAVGTEIVRGLAEGDEVVLPTGSDGDVTLPATGTR